MNRGSRWRRKLDRLVVQLKGRAEIDGGTLWWLNDLDPLAVREIGCRVHIADGVHVDGCAPFGVEDLLQPFLRTGLLRRHPVGGDC